MFVHAIERRRVPASFQCKSFFPQTDFKSATWTISTFASQATLLVTSNPWSKYVILYLLRLGCPPHPGRSIFCLFGFQACKRGRITRSRRVRCFQNAGVYRLRLPGLAFVVSFLGGQPSRAPPAPPTLTAVTRSHPFRPGNDPDAGSPVVFTTL